VIRQQLVFFLHSQLFQANRDQNSIMKNAINPPILARYVKLNPRGWYRHISMRVEYYGCVAGELTSLFSFSILKLSVKLITQTLKQNGLSF